MTRFKLISLLIILLVFIISGCGGGGGGSTTSPTNTDTEAPTAPTDLTASAISESSISLNWVASTDNVGVTGYKIYRDNVEITTTSNLYCSDTGLSAGTSYSYFVSAMDAAGNESSPSIAVSESTLNGGSSPAGADIGMNLSNVKYWSTAWQFVDRMKNANKWVSYEHSIPWDWASGYEIPVDSQGYPLEIPFDPDGAPPQGAKTILFKGDPHYPAGTYTLIFEGTGEVNISADYTGTFTKPNEPHYFEISTPTENGLIISISQSLVTDPIKNIRVIMPGFEDTYETQIFHPLFLERLRGLKSLRFLWWGEAWGSEVETWADVTPVDYFTQAGENGVAFEYMAELSNRLDADMWVCVPYLVNDEYVRTLAALLHEKLESGRKIYIEYANETWNGTHPEAQHIIDKGQEEGLPGYPGQAGFYWYARRSAQIFQIFEVEFGGTDRLIRVLAGQAANPWITEQILYGINNNEINPTSSRGDVFGIAPYFGGSVFYDIIENNEIDTITVSEILDQTEAVLVQHIAERAAEHSEITNAYGVDLVAYEGGHGDPMPWSHRDNQVLMDKVYATTRHPRMKDIMLKMYDYWFANGGKHFESFIYINKQSGYGTFGYLEYQDQPIEEAPKYDALRQILNEGL